MAATTIPLDNSNFKRGADIEFALVFQRPPTSILIAGTTIDTTLDLSNCQIEFILASGLKLSIGAGITRQVDSPQTQVAIARITAAQTSRLLGLQKYYVRLVLTDGRILVDPSYEGQFTVD